MGFLVRSRSAGGILEPNVPFLLFPCYGRTRTMSRGKFGFRSERLPGPIVSCCALVAPTQVDLLLPILNGETLSFFSLVVARLSPPG